MRIKRISAIARLWRNLKIALGNTAFIAGCLLQAGGQMATVY